MYALIPQLALYRMVPEGAPWVGPHEQRSLSFLDHLTC